MNPKSTETPKTCAYCQKVLHGRSDQVYCNDHCRNTYNRNKRAAEKVEEHENTPEIFRIIKRNYEILKRGSGPFEKNEGAFMKTSDFIGSGVNPKFFTSTTVDEHGQTWRCVFERCFSMGDEYTLFRDFPDQAEI